MTRFVIPTLGLALLLAGCSSSPPSRPPAPTPTASTGGLKAIARQELNAPQPAQERLPQPDGQSIYFTPDSTETPASAKALLADWAARLRADPRLTLTLEARTDDLGSREYCLALSEKWAGYVEESLIRQGVRATQVYIRARGSNDSGPCITEKCRTAWRRVDLREGR